ncbi:TPA: hypothetical protein ACNVV3_002703 [Pseudomonas putida]
MATIPTGPAVPRVLPDAQQNRVITMDTRAQNQAAQQLAGDVQRTAFGVLEQKQREDSALARVKASNALFERETQISTINSDLAEQVRLGSLSHDKLEEAYTSAVSKLEPLQFNGLSEPEIERMGLAQQRLQLAGQEGIRKLAIGARADAAKGDLATRLDLIGKEAAMPGVDIGKLNSRLDGEDMDMAGRLAYGEMWPAKKQEAKDANWTTQATQRVVAARDGLGTLQQIEHDLTAADGFYAGKLDPDKRNQLLNTVTGRIYQVKEHAQRQAEMREMKAMRVLDQMDKQSATGIPPSVAEQTRWQSALSGTSFAGEYNTRIKQMNEVQQVLRMPLAEQQAYIQHQRQQVAANGASVEQINNLERLDRAVTSNMQQMRDQPLEWNATRTGTQVEPLDFSGIGTPEGQMTLVGQLGGRFDTLNAMRRQVGIEVSRNPFLPQEASMLTTALEQFDDGTKLQILGVIAGAAPSGNDLTGTLKALTADKPQLLMAGLAQAQQLKASDGTAVAPTILRGAKVLADKSSIMPSDTQMSVAFDGLAGQAIPAGTQERERAFSVFKSIYAGLAGPAGVVHEQSSEALDEAVATKAMDMATGGITNYAGSKVVKPYGWSDSRFSDEVDSQLQGFVESTKIPLSSLERLPLSPVPGRDGSYYLMNAGRPQADPQTGNPIVVKLQ